MYGDAVAPRCLRLLLAQAAAVHGDEAGAEAVHAGEVLVAGRLVDGALAAELGFHRHHRDAVGLHRAVAAALADQLVDEDAFGRIGIASALTAAAFLGRTGLVVEQHADARRVAQLLLHAIEMVAVLDGDPGGPGGAGGILLRIVAHHHDTLDTLGGDLSGDHRRVERAVNRLPAGHRDGVVVEDLVGDIHPGPDGGADRQDA